MHWETLPSWFWLIHYLFLLVTLGAGVFGMFKKEIRKESILLVVLIVTFSVVLMLNAMGRLAGMNEFEWLFNELLKGSLWAIYVTLGYLYLFFWWFFIFFKIKKKESASN